MVMPIKPLAFSSPFAWLFWAVFLFVYLPEFRLIARSQRAAGQASDRSMTLIVITGWIVAFGVAGWGSFILARGQKIWFALGLASLLLGSWLRRHCFKTLGRYLPGTCRSWTVRP